MTDGAPAEPAGPAEPDEPDEPGESGGAKDQLPLRVTTLELFFDLVFAFTLTQLATLLAGKLSVASAVQVLLIFGLLWWMYEGYAWLTNSRPPIHTTERILLLLGMAGFLVVGLAIPRGFAGDGVALGLGYLVVVLVHAVLYYRVNANILRVAPFNVTSALLVTGAGLAGQHRPVAEYALWAAALLVQLGSPLLVHPKSHFRLRPAHFAERHNALVIVALGESVAAIGITAARHADARLLASAVLGLALAGALWWFVFGGDDEKQTERALTQASTERRTALALAAFFYGNIPLLLGLIATAAGLHRTVLTSASEIHAGTTGTAGLLAVGSALFMAGDAWVRRLLGFGRLGPRLAAAAVALATVAVGVTAGLDAQLAVLTAILISPLIIERRWGAEHARPGDAAG
jgi:low temperature requirement protein LtrA